MSISTRSYARGYASASYFPPGVRWLLISNTAIFVLYFFARGTAVGDYFKWFPLVPAAVVQLFFVWQLVTYMFLHGGFWHILWNMLALWMFGVDLERMWGTRRFLQFYFVCGVGAGVCVVLGNYLLPFGQPNIPTIGSSGAIYGILLAYAILFPDRVILFSFLIPIKVKYFVMIIGAIAFMNTFKPSTGVSDVAHLGGMIFAYFFLKMPRSRGIHPRAALRDQYRTWKIERAKRRFQVYLRKRGSGRDPDQWVN